MKATLRPIHIAGANGFPISLYRPLMDQLSLNMQSRAPAVTAAEARASIAGTDVFGHIQEHKDWSGMVDHLVDSIAARQVPPVTAIGHSLGGALMGCAATKRPDLFHKLILIDCPYFSLPKRLVWALGLCLPRDTVRKIHPIIQMAMKKPSHWQSKAEAQQYFKSKRMFRKFDSDVLSIFLEECLVESSDGETSLQFPVEDEIDIYLKVPC